MQAHLAAILFDKDGTLIDYHKSWSGVNRSAALMAACGDEELASRLLSLGGFDLSLDRTKPDTLLAAGSTSEIADAWAQAGSPVPSDELKRSLDRLFQESVEQAVPVMDLEALFRRLKAHGLRIGIASSDSELAIRRTTARFHLEDLVDFVAGYDSGFGTKPDPGMVLGFCRAVGIDPWEVAVVGDNLHDMAMAASGGAGLRLAVLTGTGTRESLEAACDICLESITHLERLLADEGAKGGPVR